MQQIICCLSAIKLKSLKNNIIWYTDKINICNTLKGELVKIDMQNITLVLMIIGFIVMVIIVCIKIGNLMLSRFNRQFHYKTVIVKAISKTSQIKRG